MEIKDFINKVVIATNSKTRMYLTEITAPYFRTVTTMPDKDGHYTHYSWPTINGDAFEKGYLVFEEEGLMEEFRKAYEAHLHTKDSYWELFGYWMRRD